MLLYTIQLGVFEIFSALILRQEIHNPLKPLAPNSKCGRPVNCNLLYGILLGGSCPPLVRFGVVVSRLEYIGGERDYLGEKRARGFIGDESEAGFS
jgi:hypothetical protein